MKKFLEENKSDELKMNNYFEKKLKTLIQWGKYLCIKIAMGDSESPILVYHKINNSNIDDNDSVSVENFRQQMECFFKNGLKAVSLAEYLRYRKENKKLTSGLFVLTFDDGYEDFYKDVLPILRKFGFTATVFIVAGHIGEQSHWNIKHGYNPIGLMNWNQIRGILKEGMDIGSHTLTHLDLTHCTDKEIDYEIGESKHILEQGLNYKINFLAYPFGKFNEKAKIIAKKYNYSAALTTTENVYRDNFTKGRIYIKNSDSVFKILSKVKSINMANKLANFRS